MIDSNLVPWVTAFSCISLIFVTLAITLFCIFAEKYNIHKARAEKEGHLQVARNLIKLSSIHNLEAAPVSLSLKKTKVEAAPVSLSLKKTKVDRILLTKPKLNKESTSGRIKPTSPVYSYNGTSLVAQSQCNLSSAMT